MPTTPSFASTIRSHVRPSSPSLPRLARRASQELNAIRAANEKARHDIAEAMRIQDEGAAARVKEAIGELKISEDEVREAAKRVAEEVAAGSAGTKNKRSAAEDVMEKYARAIENMPMVKRKRDTDTDE